MDITGFEQEQEESTCLPLTLSPLQYTQIALARSYTIRCTNTQKNSREQVEILPEEQLACRQIFLQERHMITEKKMLYHFIRKSI